MQIHGMEAELDSQVKLAEQYKANLSTLQQLHCNCQEEAGRLRGRLLDKETQLSRMLTTLQLTSSQVSEWVWCGCGVTQCVLDFNSAEAWSGEESKVTFKITFKFPKSHHT